MGYYIQNLAQKKNDYEKKTGPGKVKKEKKTGGLLATMLDATQTHPAQSSDALQPEPRPLTMYIV